MLGFAFMHCPGLTEMPAVHVEEQSVSAPDAKIDSASFKDMCICISEIDTGYGSPSTRW